MFSPKVPKAEDATPLPDAESPEVKAAMKKKQLDVMARSGRSSTNLNSGGGNYGSSLLGQ